MPPRARSEPLMLVQALLLRPSGWAKEWTPRNRVESTLRFCCRMSPPVLSMNQNDLDADASRLRFGSWAKVQPAKPPPTHDLLGK